MPLTTTTIIVVGSHYEGLRRNYGEPTKTVVLVVDGPRSPSEARLLLRGFASHLHVADAAHRSRVEIGGLKATSIERP